MKKQKNEEKYEKNQILFAYVRKMYYLCTAFLIWGIVC